MKLSDILITHKRWQKKRKLIKMEKTLELNLTPIQRNLILDAEISRELWKWPRRSGKTTCACLHMLLHAPATACYTKSEALGLLQDPDARKTTATKEWTYKHLYQMYKKLYKAGIRTCTILPNVPGIPNGYCGRERFKTEMSKEKKRRTDY